MIRLLAVAGCALALSGCALLSSPKPAQLYRFGAPSEAAPAPPAGTIEVGLRRMEFAPAVQGDRILGVTGAEAAYIAGARWVSPAQTLYLASLEEAFAANARRVRLIGPRDLGREQLALDLDITSFEARYGAPGAVPIVVVTAEAALVRLPGRERIAAQRFSVTQPATENRVSAIVQAFDLATRDLNTQLVDWADSAAR